MPKRGDTSNTIVTFFHQELVLCMHEIWKTKIALCILKWHTGWSTWKITKVKDCCLWLKYFRSNVRKASINEFEIWCFFLKNCTYISIQLKNVNKVVKIGSIYCLLKTHIGSTDIGSKVQKFRTVAFYFCNLSKRNALYQHFVLGS